MVTPLAATLSRDPVPLQSIETVNVDGSGRHTFPKVFLEDDDPVGLAVFENSFFWANKLQLFRTSPHTTKERVVLLNASISAFLVLHQSQQPKSKSHHLLSKHLWIRTHTKWNPPLNYYLHLLLELAILGPGKCSGYLSRRTQDFWVRWTERKYLLENLFQAHTWLLSNIATRVLIHKTSEF